jgi:hypothetical protein
MPTETSEPEVALSPGQTPEQAARLRAIVESQGKTGKSTLANLLAITDEQPLWETEAEREEFLNFVRRVRSTRRDTP